MKIYTASKTKHAAKWQNLRLQYEVVATWIDEAGEGQTACRAELAQRCIAEVAASDFVLLYCEPDEILKGALIEVGAALALNKEVRCVGLPKHLGTVFVEHPLWRTFNTIDEALHSK